MKQQQTKATLTHKAERTVAGVNTSSPPKALNTVDRALLRGRNPICHHKGKLGRHCGVVVLISATVDRTRSEPSV